MSIFANGNAAKMAIASGLLDGQTYLPQRKPRAFVIDDPHYPKLAIQLAEWRRLRGKKGTRNVLSRAVEILSPERGLREPEVRTLTKQGSEAIRREFERGLGRGR